MFVVRGVDKNFVEYFVKTRYVADVAEFHRFGRGVIDPHLPFCSLDRSDVSIGALNDVLKLCKL